jgi:hypothetical protein
MTEVTTEERNNSKVPGKPGRPKKNINNNNNSNVKAEDPVNGKLAVHKLKFSKQSTQGQKAFEAHKGHSQGFDMKTLENRLLEKENRDFSGATSRPEDVNMHAKPKHSDLTRSKAPDNIKDFLGGLNMPNEVKEFLKNSNFMGQVAWLETKKIGTLTLAERRVKIEKYLQKRKKRTWSRRINYDCRKRVADSRLRIKGRFVTRDQAFNLLDEAGIKYDPETITNADIKTMLTEKSGGSLLKKRSLSELGIEDPNANEAHEKGLIEGDEEEEEDERSEGSE